MFRAITDTVGLTSRTPSPDQESIEETRAFRSVLEDVKNYQRNLDFSGGMATSWDDYVPRRHPANVMREQFVDTNKLSYKRFLQIIIKHGDDKSAAQARTLMQRVRSE